MITQQSSTSISRIDSPGPLGDGAPAMTTRTPGPFGLQDDLSVSQQMLSCQPIPTITVNIFDIEDPKKLESSKLVTDGHNIHLAGMCNGVAQMVTDVVALSNSTQRKVSLLRIFSHGAQGHMQVTAGKTAMPGERAAITLANFSTIQNDLKPLKSIFSENALVELHGCEVGGGTTGSQLLQSLADLWGVRVQAGTLVQYSGTESTQAKFEGSTRIAYPNGATPVHQGEGGTFDQYLYHTKKANSHLLKLDFESYFSELRKLGTNW